MPNRIKPRRSYTANSVPLTSDLDTHELAINWVDGKAFTKDASGNIVSVTLGGSGGGGVTEIVEAATESAFPATGAAGKLYIATDVSRAYRWVGTAYVEVGVDGGGSSNWTKVAVPASATATGSEGQYAYGGGYFYVATGTNQWERAALSTWSNFTPASVSGLVGWFDASDSSTLVDAVTGGSAVAADGSIARWNDKSGANNHATQSTSGSRPTRRLAGLNSLPSVEFVADNADNGDWLGIAHAAALNGTSGLAIFCVYKTATTGSNRGLIGKWPGVGQETGPAWIVAYTGGNTGASVATHYTHDGTNAATQATTSTFNDGAARLLGYVNTSAGLQARMNGALQGTNTSNNLGNSASTAGIVIGGYASYGLSSGQALMSCHISELLIYSASITSQQVTNIENYLMTKWGIA